VREHLDDGTSQIEVIAGFHTGQDSILGKQAAMEMGKKAPSQHQIQSESYRYQIAFRAQLYYIVISRSGPKFEKQS
jgi:hypothetical protein